MIMLSKISQTWEDTYLVIPRLTSTGVFVCMYVHVWVVKLGRGPWKWSRKMEGNGRAC